MTQRQTGNRPTWLPPARERWSANDGKAMLEALAASAEKDAAFGRRTGVAPHRIRYWRRKLAADRSGRNDRASAPTAATGFVAVRVVKDAPAPLVRAAGQVEATLRGGTRLVFSGEWGGEQLRPWLAALEARHAE